ncbi:MAG: Ig-like domain-containing protein, partial [Pseudohongiellaceae bacterium]
ANSNDYTMTFTTVRRNTSLTASISVAANRFTDRAGNGNAASDELSIVVAADNPVISIAAVSDVREGGGGNAAVHAVFTLASDLAPDAALTVNVAVSQNGDYIAAADVGLHQVRLAASASTATLSIAIVNDDMEDALNGSVTARLQDDTAYVVNASASSATINVADDEALPNLFIVPDGPTAVTEGLPRPVLDFRVSVWGGHPTLGGGAPPALREIQVILDYAESRRQCLDHNAIPLFPPEFDGGGSTVILVEPHADALYRGSCTITVTLLPTSDYNAPASGIMSNGATGSNSVTFTLVDDEADTPENSPPLISVSAPDYVLAGDAIVFTISIPGLGAQRFLDMEFSSVGDLVPGPLPSRVFLPFGDTSSTLTVNTRDPGGADPGSLTLTMLSGATYDVSSTAGSASVAILTPSAKPTITLASDNGASNSDRLTNAIAPEFTLGNLGADATVTVQAVFPDNTGFRKTLVVAPGATGATIATVVFGNPGTGGDCELLDAQGMSTGSGSACAFSDSLANHAYDGDWRISAVHADSDSRRAPTSSDGLTITLETVAPTITLSVTAITVAGGLATRITATLSEVGSLAADDFTVSGDGSLSGFAQVTGSNSYTLDFTGIRSLTAITAVIAVAADSFTDRAGNNNEPSNLLHIVVAAIPPSAKPGLTLASDTGASADDRLTNATQPSFTLSNLAAGATTTVEFTAPPELGANQFGYRKTIITEAAATSATLVFGQPGAGGNCTRFYPGQGRTPLANQTNCDLTAATAQAYDGDWTLTARHIDGDKLPTDADALTITLDTRAPTITLASGVSSLAAGGATSIVTIAISEANDFAADQLSVSGGALSGFARAAGSDTDYTITFTAATTNTAITAAINVAAGTFADLAGNANPEASNELRIAIADSVRPGIVIAAGATSLAAGSSTAITLRISEANDFAEEDISVSGGSLTGFAAPEGDRLYTATFIAAVGATGFTASVSVAANTFTDEAGRGNEASNLLNIVVLGVVASAKPSVTLASDTGVSGSDRITNAGGPRFVLGNLLVGATVVVDARYPAGTELIYRKVIVAAGGSATVVFDSPGLGGSCAYIDATSGDVALAAATACRFEGNAGSNGDWTIVATQIESGGIMPPTDSDPLTVRFDNVRPGITLSRDGSGSLVTGGSVGVTVVVSEAGTLAAGDIAVSGGSLMGFAPVAGSATRYTATFTAGSTATTASISVAADSHTDIAGNGNEASNVLDILVVEPASAKPTLDLIAASDTGVSDSDNLTREIRPTFTLGNLTVGARVVVDALRPSRETISRKTLVAAATTETVQYGNPGMGGQCQGIFAAGGNASGPPSDVCRLGTVGGPAEGNWTITVTQTEDGRLPSAAEPLTVTLDSLWPVVSLDIDSLAIVVGATASIIAAANEDFVLAADGIAVSGGDIAGVAAIPDSSSYTLTFIAAATTTTATVSIPVGGATDLAGNRNDRPSNVLRIAIVEAGFGPSQKPTVDLAASSDNGVSARDNITNERTPVFVLGNLVVGATVFVDALRPDGRIFIRKTITALAASEIVVFGEPGAGGSCRDWRALEGRPRTREPMDECFFNPAGSDISDGNWRVSATQTEIGGSRAATTSDSLLVVLDTVRPTAVLVTGGFTASTPDAATVIVARLEGGESTGITVSASEAIDIGIDDISVSGGSLSGFAAVDGSATDYTFTFTSAFSRTAITASIAINENAYADTAGNGGMASNVLEVAVEASRSAKPSLDLVSDAGASATDGLTNSVFPVFTLGNLVAGATVVVQAAGPGGGVRKTITASGSTATVVFGRPGAGGSCETLDTTGVSTGSGDECFFSSGLDNHDNDGAWSITATQTEAGDVKLPTASETLALRLETVAPTVALATGAAALNANGATLVTFTVSEATDFAADDIRVGGGVLSGFVLVAGTNTYTARFTAAASLTALTASISVAAGAFTDRAGNGNEASLVLEIPVAALVLSAKPTVALAVGSDLGVSDGDGITNDSSPALSIGNLVAGAAVVVEALHPAGTFLRRKSLRAGGATETVVYGRPGAGGLCDFVVTATGAVTANLATCSFVESSDSSDGDWTITVTQTEAGGAKVANVSDPLTVTFDATPPGIAISAGDTSLVGGRATTITFAVSEASNFAEEHISVTGGSLSDFMQLAETSVYTASFTAELSFSAITAEIDVSENVFTDLAGNDNEFADAILYIPVRAVIRSAKPSVRLAVDGGVSASDGVINDPRPGLTIGNLKSGATVVVDAVFDDVSGMGSSVWYRKTLTAVGATAEVAFGNPGAGGNCETLDAQGVVVSSGGTDCAFNSSDAEDGNDGDWRITATQTESGDVYLATASDQLRVNLDTLAPTVVLAAGASLLTVGDSTRITLTASETVSLAVGDITVSGGNLSDFALVADAGATIYTVTFTAAASSATSIATVSVAADAFTDIAGNGNEAGNLLQIAVAVPSLSISATPAAVMEGAAATFTVVAVPTPLRELSVALSIADGDSLIDGAVAMPPDHLTLAAGQTAASFTLTAVDNGVDDPGASLGSFAVSLASVADIGAAGYVVGAPASASVNVLDDEGTAALSVSDVAVGESEDLVFVVAMSPASGQTVEVDYATSDGPDGGVGMRAATASSDYTAVDDRLTFMPGETEKRITVSVTDDLLDEDTEQFTLSLSNASAAASIADGSAIGAINDNDVPSLSISATPASVMEGGAATFTLAADLAPHRELTVALNLTDANSLIDNTVAMPPESVTLMAGQTSASFALTAVANGLDDPGTSRGSFAVTLAPVVNVAVAGYALGTPASASVTVLDDAGMSMLSIAAEQVASMGSVTTVDSVAEATPAKPLRFVISLLPPSAQTIIVSYATTDGPGDGAGMRAATAGTDYTAAVGRLTFAPGETSMTIAVDIADDRLDEDSERFTLNLFNASAGASIVNASVIGTIHDNDVPVLSISVAPAAVMEGDAASFTIAADIAPVGDLTVALNYTSADLLAAAPPATVTLTAMQTSATFSITALDNQTDEPGATLGTFIATLVPVADVDVSGYALGMPTSASVSVMDDEGMSMLSVAAARVTEATPALPLEFVVSLMPPSALTVTVSYATSDGPDGGAGMRAATEGVDYIVESGTLTFMPGESSKTISVGIVDDRLDEDAEVLTLTLSNASAGASILTGSAIGTINDNDVPALSVNAPSSVLEGESAIFVIVADIAPRRDLSVDLNHTDADSLIDTAIAVPPDSLTLTAGQGAASFTLTAVNNELDDPGDSLGSFTLALAPVVISTEMAGYTVGTPSAVTVSVFDDEGITLLSIAADTVTEATPAPSLEFALSLDPPSAQTVTVAYATSDQTARADADYTAIADVLTFMPGATGATITVSIADDDVDENAEMFALVFSEAGNATLPGGAVVYAAIGTINDNDMSLLSSSDSAAAEGGQLAFTVALRPLSELTVVVDYATADGTAIAGEDYTAATDRLTFAPGLSSRQITVSVIDDKLDEDAETLVLTLSNVRDAMLSGGVASVELVGTINDNDVPVMSISAAPDSVLEGEAATFTLAADTAPYQDLTVALAVMDADSLIDTAIAMPPDSLTLMAGQSAASFTLTAIANVKDDPGASLGSFAMALVAVADVDAVGYSVGMPSSASVSVLDDEGMAMLSVAATDRVVEATPAQPLEFAVSLLPPSAQTVTVAYATSDGTAIAGEDYASAAGILTFTPGEVGKTVLVTVARDAAYEDDETVLLNLSGASGAGISGAQASGVIGDGSEIVFGVAASATEVSEVMEDVLLFTVELSVGRLERALDLGYDLGGTASDADYAAPSVAAIAFAAGDSSQTVTLTVLNDDDYDPNETISLTLTNPGARVSYSPATTSVTIIDDDPLPLIVPDVSIDGGANVTEGDPGDATVHATFVLAASPTPNRDMVVSVAVSQITGLLHGSHIVAADSRTHSLGFA